VAHQERINLFFKCVGFCGGLRRFLRGFPLHAVYAYNFTPHPPVVQKYVKFSKKGVQYLEINFIIFFLAVIKLSTGTHEPNCRSY
jgi:hypothetical protein